MVLKTSGLIPQWWSDRTMAAFRHRIQDLRSECHKQSASDLAPTYDFIVFSTFEMSQMVVKTSHNLRSKTARAMMNWAGARRSNQTLQHLCYLYGSKLVGSKEEYTSKTFGSWGKSYLKLGGSPKFNYPDCGYEIPRDCQVVCRIFWQALWDTISIANAQARSCCT
jgi:putative transposase